MEVSFGLIVRIILCIVFTALMMAIFAAAIWKSMYDSGWSVFLLLGISLGMSCLGLIIAIASEGPILHYLLIGAVMGALIGGGMKLYLSLFDFFSLEFKKFFEREKK